MHLIATEGPLRGLVINFDDGDEWVIGRDPDQADVILEDTAVSRQHAHLSKTSDGIVLTNLSTTNPLLINDSSLMDSHLLHEGDRVQIGNNVFLYSEENAPDLPPGHEEIEETPLDLSDTSYDTIFEETEEEEIPYQLLGVSGLILKVLSGPNAGAEIQLDTDKSYLVGKDASTCDIIFNDLSVSKEHAKLHVDEERKISLEDLHSKNGTIVNNKAIKETTDITSDDVIAFGTTTCIIVDQNVASETIYSPAPIVEAEKSEAEEAKEKEEEWKKQKIPTSMLVGSSFGVMILLVLFLSFFGLMKGEKISIPKSNPVEKIHQIVKNYPTVEFSFNPTGHTLFIVGHVTKDIDLQELTYDLDQLPFVEKIEDKIVVDEKIAKNMNDVLSETTEWRSVNMHTPKPGSFVIGGYVETPKEAEELNDYINLNFNFLEKLTNEIHVDQIIQAEVNALLLSNGLDGVKFQMTGGELLLEGLYSEDQEKTYHLTKEHLSQVSGIRAIKDLAILSTASLARIDLSNKYKVTGYASRHDENFSVVVNGQILGLGDEIDGMMVTDIESDTVLLEKTGVKYKINYTRSR